MAAPVRTNQVNQLIRHPRTTFAVAIVSVNKNLCLNRRSRIHPKLSTRCLILNALSKVNQRDSNYNFLVNSLKV